MKRLFFYLLALVALLATPLSSLLAVPVTDVSDRMSDQRVGAASDHEFRFTNSDPINASGKVIDLVFASGFSLTGIVVADIAFTHGPSTGLETAETLSATSGSGVWTVSIAGNTISFTSPTDATKGELPSGHKVVIKIGTNAGGTHQITNPSSAGNYPISVDGSLGQYEGTGTVAVPIVLASAGGFTIGFTVPEATSEPADASPVDPGGGGVGAPPAPIVPPPVLQPRVLNATISRVEDTAALVTWDTDMAASGEVVLSATGLGDRTVPAGESGYGFSVPLLGLVPETDYRALIRVSSGSGTPVSFGPLFFRTLPTLAVPNVQSFAVTRTPADPALTALSWVLPLIITSNDEIVVVARTDRYPTGIADGRTVFRGHGTAATDRAGTGATFYTIFVQRGSRVSSGSVASVPAVTPTTPAPPAAPPTAPIVSTPVPSTGPARPSGSGSLTPSEAPIRPPMGAGGVGSVASTTSPIPSSATSTVATDPILPGPTATSSTVLVPMVPTAPLPAVPTTTVVVPAAPAFRATTQWQTQDEKLVLAEDGGRPRVFANDAVRLVLTTNQELRTGQVTVDGSRYALAREGAMTYVTTFVPSATDGVYDATFSLVSGSGEVSSFSRQIDVVAPARVLERDQDDRPAQGASVTIFALRGEVWEVTLNGTVMVAEDGTYRTYLPAGQYRLEVSKEGWRTERQEFRLEAAAPIEQDIVLERSPVGIVAKTLEAIRTPESEAVASIAAPVAVAATLGTTVAVSAFNIFNYLRFLLTQPLLLLRRRRRDKWGTVYHALTKRPIELAVVRLVDAKTGAVRQTRITDAQGRFAFLAPAGSYRIEVRKPGFVFPTQLLANERIDVDLVDLYHGEPIDAEASVSLTPNIPLDPIEKVETPREIVRKGQWRKAQSALSIVSLLVAGIAVLIQPTWLMAGFAVLQVVAFLLFRRLAVPAKPKNWGIAYDGTTRKPLKQAVVRIFDKKYNKLLETQVTDRDGKYAFFAGKNVYYVTADRSGYEKLTSKDLDMRQESLGVVHEPLALMPSVARPAVPSDLSA